MASSDTIEENLTTLQEMETALSKLPMNTGSYEFQANANLSLKTSASI